LGKAYTYLSGSIPAPACDTSGGCFGPGFAVFDQVAWLLTVIAGQR